MIHHQQNLNFRNWIFSFTSSKTSALFHKSRNKQIKIGKLVKRLIEELKKCSGFDSLRLNFTIINIVARGTGFSRGCSLAPEEELLPANKHIVFTFSLSRFNSIDDIKIVVTNRRNNSVVQFGSIHEKNAFVSIGLTFTECSELGVSNPHQAELNYLYNVIGPLTKSIIRWSSSKVETDTYSVLHKPLSFVIENSPFHWPYSKELWKYAPNILTTSDINDNVALNYFDAIHYVKDVPIYLVQPLIKILSSSIVLFVQNLEAQKLDYTELELVAGCALYGYLYGDNNLDTGTKNDLLVSEFFDKIEEISKLLLPPRESASKIFFRETGLRKLLLNVINME